MAGLMASFVPVFRFRRSICGAHICRMFLREWSDKPPARFPD